LGGFGPGFTKVRNPAPDSSKQRPPQKRFVGLVRLAIDCASLDLITQDKYPAEFHNVIARKLPRPYSNHEPIFVGGTDPRASRWGQRHMGPDKIPVIIFLFGGQGLFLYQQRRFSSGNEYWEIYKSGRFTIITTPGAPLPPYPQNRFPYNNAPGLWTPVIGTTTPSTQKGTVNGAVGAAGFSRSSAGEPSPVSRFLPPATCGFFRRPGD